MAGREEFSLMVKRMIAHGLEQYGGFVDTLLKATPETRERARTFSVSATTHNCLGHNPGHSLFSILLASRVQIASPVVHQGICLLGKVDGVGEKFDDLLPPWA